MPRPPASINVLVAVRRLLCVVLLAVALPATALAGNGASLVGHTLPASLSCGESYTATVTMYNSGTTTWSEATRHRLGITGTSDPLTTSSEVRIELPAGVTVPPGSQYTFQIPMVGPATAGTHGTYWRMVEEQVEYFGPTASRNVVVTCDNSATLVNETLPTSLACGESYTATIRMRNNGDTVWSESTRHRLGITGTSDPLTGSSEVRIELPAGVTVAPGQRYTFSIPMTAPSSEGVYTTSWRMVEENVEYFGPTVSRSVTVSCSNAATLVSQTLPTNLTCGQQYTATIRMRNSGSTVWSEATRHRLGITGTSDPLTTSSEVRIELPAGVTVPPGGEYSFQIPMTAPADENSYFTSWRMVEEQVEYFGPTVSRTVNVSCSNGASLVSQTIPSSLTCGQSVTATIRMRNTGDTTWSEVTRHRLGITGTSDPLTGPSEVRIELPAGVTVPPNGTYTFQIPMTAPMTDGPVTTTWRMVEEQVEYFGATVSRTVDIDCGNGAALVNETLPDTLYCGDSYTATIRMRNTGDTVWSEATRHRLGITGTSDPLTGPSEVRIELPAGVTVPPNGTYTFQIPMTAPMTDGSVTTTWRMVEEQVEYFGTTVSKSVGIICGNRAELVSQTLPPSLGCGQSYGATITMRNKGSTVWRESTGHRLGITGTSDPLTGPNEVRIELPAGVTVGREGEHTFQIPMTAPMSEGPQTTSWRMVEEGVEYFGPPVSETVQIGCDNGAALVGHTLPQSMTCGESYIATVTMRNTGDKVWSEASRHRLGITGTSDPLTGPSEVRIELPAGVTVANGSSYVFQIPMTAPANEGTYRTEWRMVEEQVEYFGPVAAEDVVVEDCTPQVDDAAIISADLPTQLDLGQTYAASVTVRNTGTTTWTSSTYELAAVGLDDPFTTALVHGLPAGLEVQANGSHTFSFSLTAPQNLQPGSYVTDWQMRTNGGAGFGAVASATVEVVDPSAPVPSISAVSRDTIRLGTQAQVTLDGVNFQGAQVGFAEQPENPDADPPDATSVGVTASRIDLTVDARSMGEPGFHFLTVQTDGGTEMVPIRIVAPGPVIDSYAPSQGARDGIYVLAIAGANLSGASVSVPSSVQILDLDNSDDAFLSGLLYVPPGAGTGSRQITVSNQGRSVSLPLQIVSTAGQINRKTDPVAAGSDTTIYVQEALAFGEAAELSGSSSSGLFSACVFFSRSLSRERRFTLSLFRDLLNDTPIVPGEVLGLVPGAQRLIQATVLQIEFSIEFSISLGACVFRDPFGEWRFDAFFEVCVRFELRAMTPGVGGRHMVQEFCLSGTVSTELGAQGGLTSLSVQGEGCADPEVLSPPSIGEVDIEVEVPETCECDEPGSLSFASSGSAFFEFTLPTQPIGDGTEVDCTVSTEQVEYTAVAWVDAGPPTDNLANLDPNPALFAALHVPVTCDTLLLDWSLGFQSLVWSDEDRRYANAFLLSRTGNTPPPDQIDLATFRTGEDYRLYNRMIVELRRQVDGSVEAEVLDNSEAHVGPTPVPCFIADVLTSGAPETHPDNGRRFVRESPSGGASKIFQIASGRLGEKGQDIDTTLNDCGAPYAIPPLLRFCPNVSDRPTGFSTGWIWAVPVIGPDGAVLRYEHSIFPSFKLFDENGAVLRNWTSPQAPAEQFIELDDSYQFEPGSVR